MAWGRRFEPGIAGAPWLLLSVGRVQEGARAQPTCLPARPGHVPCTWEVRPPRAVPWHHHAARLASASGQTDAGPGSRAGRTQTPCLALPSVTGGFRGAEVLSEGHSHCTESLPPRVTEAKVTARRRSGRPHPPGSWGHSHVDKGGASLLASACSVSPLRGTAGETSRVLPQ